MMLCEYFFIIISRWRLLSGPHTAKIFTAFWIFPISILQILLLAKHTTSDTFFFFSFDILDWEEWDAGSEENDFWAWRNLQIWSCGLHQAVQDVERNYGVKIQNLFAVSADIKGESIWINLTIIESKVEGFVVLNLEFKQIRQFSLRLFTMQWYPWPMTADKEWNGIIHVSVLRLNSIIHIFFQANPLRSSNRICQILFF